MSAVMCRLIGVRNGQEAARKIEDWGAYAYYIFFCTMVAATLTMIMFFPLLVLLWFWNPKEGYPSLTKLFCHLVVSASMMEKMDRGRVRMFFEEDAAPFFWSFSIGFGSSYVAMSIFTGDPLFLTGMLVPYVLLSLIYSALSIKI